MLATITARRVPNESSPALPTTKSTEATPQRKVDLQAEREYQAMLDQLKFFSGVKDELCLNIGKIHCEIV